jgi:hypothetical protein
MSKILILTNINDPHADAVIKKIKNKENVFRVNTDYILSTFNYEFLIDNDVNYTNFRNPNRDVINLEDVSCVYYRRPERPEASFDKTLMNVIVDEAWHGMYHLLFNLYDRSWLGHPHKDKYASSRVVQLNLAKKIGWKIPPTLISKTANEVRDFAKKYKDLALKPLGGKGVSYSNKWVPYFTSKISSAELELKTDDEISLTYNYLQAYIPKKNEWRITVIGEDVFPCIIHSQECEASKVDWRTTTYDSISHQKGAISDTFKNQLVQYIKDLNMPFGAFDFILTPDDEFVFLECNPNGQWLWIEELTGMPIAQSIASWLENTNNDFIS